MDGFRVRNYRIYRENSISIYFKYFELYTNSYSNCLDSILLYMHEILKGEGEFLYDRVKFAFYDNSILDNIKVEDVSQNRSWIIAKNQENMEYRFKVKDIKTIKYSNFENQTECEQ